MKNTVTVKCTKGVPEEVGGCVSEYKMKILVYKVLIHYPSCTHIIPSTHTHTHTTLSTQCRQCHQTPVGEYYENRNYTLCPKCYKDLAQSEPTK